MVQLIRKEIKWISILNTASQALGEILIYLVNFIDMDYKGQCKNDGRLKTDNIQWNKFRVKERVSLSIKYFSLQKQREPWRFYSKKETTMSKMVLFLPTDVLLHYIKLLISLLLLHYSVPHYYLAFESLLLHSLRSPPLQFQ